MSFFLCTLIFGARSVQRQDHSVAFFQANTYNCCGCSYFTDNKESFQQHTFEQQRLTDIGSSNLVHPYPQGIWPATLQIGHEPPFGEPQVPVTYPQQTTSHTFWASTARPEAISIHSSQVMSDNVHLESPSVPTIQLLATPFRGDQGDESQDPFAINIGESPPLEEQITATVDADPQLEGKPHRCLQEGCDSAFNRRSDLDRHRRRHEYPTLHCLATGCPRKGRNGFSRWDKFKSHQETRHGLGLRDVPWGYSVRGSEKIHQFPCSVN